MCTQFDLQFIVSLSAFWNIGIGFTTVKVTNKGFTLPEVEERKDAWFFLKEKERKQQGRAENLCSQNCWLCCIKKVFLETHDVILLKAIAGSIVLIPGVFGSILFCCKLDGYLWSAERIYFKLLGKGDYLSP